MEEVTWNPWHGCHKYSEGCLNCYVYRTDGKHERDASIVKKTLNFDLPLKRRRGGEYKIPPGSLVYACFTSDFFVEDADAWRGEAWRMMKERGDLSFLFLTKRIERFNECLPPDWGEGYSNVAIGCTCESARTAAVRLPIFKEARIAHKLIICEPLLTELDLSPWLGPWVEQVVAGGESGLEARECDFEWIKKLRAQCEAAGVRFRFKQTGAHFIKDGKRYIIPRKFQHAQARKAGLDYYPKEGQ